MLTLTSGQQSLVVAPHYGGAILGWTAGRTRLLRAAAAQAAVWGDMHAMAGFPLLPYANRIRDARMLWRGTEYTLAHNFGDEPNSIHGIGWQRAWRVERIAPEEVELALEHDATGSGALGWPFSFNARLTYTLRERGLTVQLAVTSRHDAPAPVGVGFHPYFPSAGVKALQFKADGVWQTRNTLPDRLEPVPDGWNHEAGRPVGTLKLDHCFVGWTGKASINAGPASLDITADRIFGNLQVFTPAGENFFCVEPVSHIPDAINRPDLPMDQAMHTLAPGETLAGAIRLDLPPVR